MPKEVKVISVKPQYNQPYINETLCGYLADGWELDGELIVTVLPETKQNEQNIMYTQRIIREGRITYLTAAGSKLYYGNDYCRYLDVVCLGDRVFHNGVSLGTFKQEAVTDKQPSTPQMMRAEEFHNWHMSPVGQKPE